MSRAMVPYRKTQSKRYPKKRKQRQMTRVQGPYRSMVARAERKYFDTTSVGNSIGAGATLFAFGGIPQGDNVNSRVGDFACRLDGFLNFSLYIANTDIFTTIVLSVFEWSQNSAFNPPTIAQLFQSPSNVNSLSHWNHENQQLYQVLWQYQFRAVGTATNPTVNSNFGHRNLRIKPGRHRDQQYDLGTVNGTSQLFMLAISDSALTPFPILNFSFRQYFEDSIRARPLGYAK